MYQHVQLYVRAANIVHLQYQNGLLPVKVLIDRVHQLLSLIANRTISTLKVGGDPPYMLANDIMSDPNDLLTFKVMIDRVYQL